MTKSNLAATQNFLYRVHDKFGRPVIESRLAARNHIGIALGGWEMMRAIGLDVKNCLLKEAELGAFIAMTTPTDYGYTEMRVANTSLGDALNARLANELAILNAYNEDYSYQARTFGRRMTFMHADPSSQDKTRNCLNQDTGVTESHLQYFCESGCSIFPDRNDPRLASFLGAPALFDATDRLNDKIDYYRFLRKIGSTFSRPTAVLIDEISLELLNVLAALEDDEALEEFVRLMNASQGYHEGVNTSTNAPIVFEGVFDPSINYFVKVAGGAGGNVAESSMCRLYPVAENAKVFKGILNNLIRRAENGVRSKGLLLNVPIDVREPNTANPLDPANKQYYSPCLTLRIGPNGQFAIGQVAEQVLAGGLSWVGAYWNQLNHDAFVVEHMRHIEQLARTISALGYFGYFGTDFVQDKKGIYQMTVDGNARMNGNDMMHLVRRPLELQGVGVKDVYMSFIKFEADDGAHAQAIDELYGQFRYSHLKYAGLTLWPSLNPDTYLGTSSVRKAAAIYVNPSYEPERFSAFLKAVQ